MALMCLVTSCQKDEDVVSEETNYTIDLNLAMETDWRMADEILVLVNEHRATKNLAPIERDRQHASAFAVDHTFYMIDKKQINHDNFGIRSAALKDRGAEVVGENVAFGYDTAEGVVNAWLNSDSHRSIIEGSYTHSGFGVLTDENGRYYFTQLFYRR
jgi:uncharacterized protein YkwD